MITARTATTVLTAGALATLAFDIFGQGLAPLFGYAKLAPTPLAGATLKSLFGANPSGAASLVHFFTGIVGYALGWFLIARPIQRMVLPSLPWIVTAVAYGILLWVFALYFVAHLIAGNAPFLGFSGITWVAFWGHIVYAVVAAWVMEAKGAVLPVRDRALVPAE